MIYRCILFYGAVVYLVVEHGVELLILVQPVNLPFTLLYGLGLAILIHLEREGDALSLHLLARHESIDEVVEKFISTFRYGLLFDNSGYAIFKVNDRIRV